MREYIDHNDVANTVMMLRSAFKGIIVLVEGNTDDRLYGKFLDPEGTETVVAQSKANVGRTLKELSRRKEDMSLGIVDSDLDLVKKVKREPPLFLTDTRDLESMMFFSSALESLLSEYADRESLRMFTDRYGDIRARVCDSCYPVGLLMLISDREGMNLSFKNLDFSSFIDRRTLRCDVRRMVMEVIDSTMHTSVRPDFLTDLIENEKEHDRKHICRGHDITEVLALALRYIFGSYNAKTIQANQVAGGMRLSFTSDDMRSTALYASTKEWAQARGVGLWKV